MQNVYGRGQANGLSGLKMLSAEEVRELEPNCRAVRAIHVPETGIVDYVQVAGKMAELIQQRGGRILTGAGVSAIRRQRIGLVLDAAQGPAAARHPVDCGGLRPDAAARLPR